MSLLTELENLSAGFYKDVAPPALGTACGAQNYSYPCSSVFIRGKESSRPGILAVVTGVVPPADF